MLSLRLFFSKWLRLLLFSSLASAFACISVELCMFGDAFAACFGGNDATMTVTGDSVDASAAAATAAVAVAVAVVVTAPSVTNNAIVVLVAHK